MSKGLTTSTGPTLSSIAASSQKGATGSRSTIPDILFQQARWCYCISDYITGHKLICSGEKCLYSISDNTRDTNVYLYDTDGYLALTCSLSEFSKCFATVNEWRELQINN